MELFWLETKAFKNSVFRRSSGLTCWLRRRLLLLWPVVVTAVIEAVLLSSLTLLVLVLVLVLVVDMDRLSAKRKVDSKTSPCPEDINWFTTAPTTSATAVSSPPPQPSSESSWKVTTPPNILTLAIYSLRNGMSVCLHLVLSLSSCCCSSRASNDSKYGVAGRWCSNLVYVGRVSLLSVVSVLIADSLCCFFLPSVSVTTSCTTELNIYCLWNVLY